MCKILQWIIMIYMIINAMGTLAEAMIIMETKNYYENFKLKRYHIILSPILPICALIWYGALIIKHIENTSILEWFDEDINFNKNK